MLYNRRSLFAQVTKTPIFALHIYPEGVTMISLRLYLIISMAALMPFAAAQGPYIPPDKPKLVIGVVVEQLRFDQLEKARSLLTANGIRRLINEGTYYRNAHFKYMLIQGAPGYATIYTGAEPSLHGIPSDRWYEPLSRNLIEATEDMSVRATGGSYQNGKHSAANLLATTFSDELKLASNGISRSFSVGFKNYSAVLGGGHTSDGAFWFDDQTGTWMSSTFYMEQLPGWVVDFNAMQHASQYLSKVWNPLLVRDRYYMALPDSASSGELRGVNGFPYDLDKMSRRGLISRTRDYSLLAETPFSNSLTTDFVLKLIEEEGMGKGQGTDFIAIAYNANDNIGHRFGPSSVESYDALLRLDREIERLLDRLNDSLGKQNILLFFTAAHGVSEVPSVLQQNRIPAGRFRQNQALSLLRTYLNALYGEGDWIRGYHERQIFLNRTLIEDARIPLDEIQRVVARFIVQFSGVSAAYPFSAFESGSFSNGHMMRISNNFSPVRSGDVIVVLHPGWIDNSDYLADHGSPFGYDSHVPLIWYGWSVNRATIHRRINMTGVAATISAILGIPMPNASDSELLEEILR